MQPIKVSGKILDAKGTTVIEFNTGISGTGLFSFVPQAGESYSAEVTYPDSSRTVYPLSQVLTVGAEVDLFDKEEGKEFIVAATPGFNNRKLRLLAVVQNRIVAKAEVIPVHGFAEGFINTRNMDPGLMQLLLFEENGNLVSYTNTFINAGEMKEKGSIRTDTLNFSAKGLNVLHIVFPDSVAGNFSMAITDISDGLPEKAPDNIHTGLLLQSGNKLYMPPVPAGAGTEQVEELVMSGNWPVYYSHKPPLYREHPFISVKGKVFKELRRDRSITDNLNIIVQTKDSSTTFFSLTLLQNDSFELKNLVYEDSARFFYQLNAKKNADKYLNIRLDTTLMTHPVPGTEGLDPWFNSCKTILFNQAIREKAASVQEKYMAAKAKGTTLEEVVIKVKTISKEKQLDKEYTSGIFSGSYGARMIDVGSDVMSANAINIFRYLEGTIPGVDIYYDLHLKPPHWVIKSRRNFLPPVLSKSDYPDGLIFVNESQMDADLVATIPVRQIAYVKYFPPASFPYFGAGAACVLAIYTKKGDDWYDMQPVFLNKFKYPGYTPAKTFSMPDYSNEINNVPDFRTTLYWNPELILDGSSKETTITFYNSDNAKKFRVILEGVTTKGELVHIDKIIAK
ncbi:MAG: hypothetical protein U0U70_02420 [Chitinophagaceae bacterium]